MRHKIILIVLVIILAAAWCAFSQQQRLDIEAFEMPRRPGALFDHDFHNEKAGLDDDCSVCHHVYEEKKLVPDESSEDRPCSDCHRVKPGPENNISLVIAFHRRCKTCHFDSNKGPVICGQCHVKR